MNDHTAVIANVSILEARARAAEERATQEEFIKDASIQEVVEWAVYNFKQSEEFVAIMTTQYDAGYDMRVEDIFFNIWRKRRDVDYRLLGENSRTLWHGGLMKKGKAYLTPGHHLHPSILRQRKTTRS